MLRKGSPVVLLWYVSSPSYSCAVAFSFLLQSCFFSGSHACLAEGIFSQHKSRRSLGLRSWDFDFWREQNVTGGEGMFLGVPSDCERYLKRFGKVALIYVGKLEILQHRTLFMCFQNDTWRLSFWRDKRASCWNCVVFLTRCVNFFQVFPASFCATSSHSRLLQTLANCWNEPLFSRSLLFNWSHIFWKNVGCSSAVVVFTNENCLMHIEMKKKIVIFFVQTVMHVALYYRIERLKCHLSVKVGQLFP